MSEFSQLVDDMDSALFDALSTAVGEHRRPGCRPRSDVQLIIDHNLQQVGPQGLHATDALGISCRCEQVPDVDRGDLFIVGCKRYAVELVLSNDGHVITAACMEIK
ncbi:head-tail joining protein [Stutzerimonas nitrititolerans]|uniref:head-tail joining protein n=1 Tax=Stutzerimonas nitrititolerans TaxID=2482751 RepID=UPI0028AD18FE|nr:hypothetical protein [Stutzerimonas nitrititolerans]